MAKFAIVSDSGLSEEKFPTFDEAVVEAKTESENSPDCDFFVVEVKAKIVSELKTDIITDENQF